MAQKFNPLLKLGLQEIGKDYSSDISALQNAINSLQSQANALQTALNTLKGNKITKCFSSADLANLEDNEIFEWQGESGTVDETAFVNGFFYKKEVTQIVLVSPVSGAYITNADFSYNGFYYANGNVYAKNVSNTIPLNHSYTLIDINAPDGTELITVNLDGADWQQPGTIYSYVDSDRICHKVTLVSCTGAGGAGKFNYDFGNGLVVYGNGYSTISGIVEGKSFVDTNDNRYDLCINPNITSWGVACIKVDSNNNIIDFWPSQAVFKTYYSDVTINSATYTQTNTQPGNSYTLPKATSNILGGVVIGNYLDNSNALTLDFAIFGTGDDEMPDVTDDYFDVEVATLWFHIFRFKVVCTDNFSGLYHTIVLPFNFVFDFYGYIYDENYNCIGHYSLSGRLLFIYKNNNNIDFLTMNELYIIAFT